MLYDVRCRSTDISLAIAGSALRITSSVTGSTRALASPGDDEISVIGAYSSRFPSYPARGPSRATGPAEAATRTGSGTLASAGYRTADQRGANLRAASPLPAHAAGPPGVDLAVGLDRRDSVYL